MDILFKIFSITWSIFALFALRGEGSQQCYSCRYSTNQGCDLTVDTGRISSTITCNNDCYTQITRSSDGSNYEVVRGCYTSPVCNDVSYSVDDSAYILECCSGDECNDDLSKKTFECMQCTAEDGKDSVCPNSGFWDSRKASIDTVYCTSFCQKEVRVDEDTTTVSRSCVDSCQEDSYSAFGILTETHCCRDKDACNSAPEKQACGIGMMLVAIGIAATVAKMIF